MAAGISLMPDCIDELRSRLNEIARRSLNPASLQAPLSIDADVGLDELTLRATEELARLNPTGQGNPPLHFRARGLNHSRPLKRMGAEKQHVKMWVTDGAATLEAVWWGAGGESLPVGTFDLAFTPQENHYNGQRSVQLKVLDWQA